MLENKILETIKKFNLIEEKDKIVVAVSGGPDSMCLLDNLNCLKNYLKIEIVVAHVNHMMREEAEDETKYVKNYCNNNGIPCYVKYADVLKQAKEQKIGTEEMGRKVRYSFFEEIAKNVNATKIAIAHTENDNAETVLMNIIRGASIEGIKGIEPIRGKYIRPLIECSREEIEQYCEEKKLEPKLDKSNKENIYTRNKIRNLLIPYIQKEFNPNIIKTLNRMAISARDNSQYFGKIVEKEYENLLLEEEKDEIILDLKKFNKLEYVIKSRVLLYTINIILGTKQGIDKVNVEDMIKLCENNVGNKYLIPNKNVKIFVKKGKIFIYKL
jgi:tRNA(Ile)-lysidine synthase